MCRHATSRMSATSGVTITSGRAINDPLGPAIAPDGDILTANGGNGNLVETTSGGRATCPVSAESASRPRSLSRSGAVRAADSCGDEAVASASSGERVLRPWMRSSRRCASGRAGAALLSETAGSRRMQMLVAAWPCGLGSQPDGAVPRAPPDVSCVRQLPARALAQLRWLQEFLAP